MLSNLDNTEGEQIKFRFKQRLTLELLSDSINTLLIDLTMVKTSDNVSTLVNAVKAYEIEIDYSTTKLDKKLFQ